MLKTEGDRSKGSFLRQVNPLLKIGVSIVFTSLALALRDLQALGLLVSCLFGLVLASVRLQRKILIYSLISVAIVVGLSMAFQGFGHPIASLLRIGAMLLPTPLLAGTTAPADLVRALQAVHLPNFMVLSLMLIWRFLPLMQQETRRIFEANQLRGIDLTRQPQHWFSGLLMPLLFRVVAYADDVTIGLETRGYDPAAPRSVYRSLSWQPRDTGFLMGAIGLLAIVSYVEWER